MSATPEERRELIEHLARAIYDAYVEYLRPRSGPRPLFLSSWEQLEEVSREQERYVARRLIAMGLVTGDGKQLIGRAAL